MQLSLLPIPRQLSISAGQLSLAAGQLLLPPSPTPATLFAARQLQEAIQRYAAAHFDLRCAPGVGTPIVLSIHASAGGPEGYRLSISSAGISIVGGAEAGLFYGVQTLIQILRQCSATVPCLEIQDAPDFPARGVMLDISRDKVPTMATLYALVDLLAEWKTNQIQLYMEHTFAYTQHPEAWANASPLTHEEVLQLDRYCRQRHIQLVPNQNSFGHMERWLRLPRYYDLAEAPEGSDTPWNSRWEGPFSLCPTDPRSIDLLSGLYTELLPHFSSRLFNVGCDETFDIGQGKSKAQVEATSKTRVYLDFLLQIHRLVRQHGRTMMFWGDIILHQPQLIAELPKDIIAMEWGYEASHPFDKDGEHFAKAGVPFYVCPGTSSWCTIAGRTDNALANLLSAAENGLKYGAIGYLNTDWGDHGHLQYLPISYLGFAAGAAYSWSLAANRQLDLPRALDLHAFHDTSGSMGKLAFDLGNVYQKLKLMGNSSALFWLIVSTKGRGKPDCSVPQLDAVLASIDQAMAPLSLARMQRDDAATLQAEFANAAAMLRHGARRGRWLLDPSTESLNDLTADLRQIIGRHEDLWLARNRSGGLVDSANRLRETLKAYSEPRA